MITINGITLDVDFTDADVQERYNKASQKLDNAKYTGLGMPEATRKASGNVRDFIDAIYGSGIGIQVLPRDSMRDMMHVVDEIVGDANAQFAEVSSFEEKFRSLGKQKS